MTPQIFISFATVKLKIPEAVHLHLYWLAPGIIWRDDIFKYFKSSLGNIIDLLDYVFCEMNWFAGRLKIEKLSFLKSNKIKGSISSDLLGVDFRSDNKTTATTNAGSRRCTALSTMRRLLMRSYRRSILQGDYNNIY